MSKILGIVSEYNPFHNGHFYHLEESKRIVNPDYTVCIMSGNFVERGNTSIIDKWSKAEVALKMGVDLVIELPTVYSISSAENFAEGAIKILSYFPNVTLSFGSECGNINILKDIAKVLYQEPKQYVTMLSHELAKGLSFPKARENALMFYLNDVRKYANILSEPNNILGLEYLKAILKLKSHVIPVTLKRTGTEYNSLETLDNFASATAIRNLIKEGKDIKPYVPYVSSKSIKNNLKYGKTVNDILCFEKEIIYTLRKLSLDEIKKLPDVSEGLEHVIKNASNTFNTLPEIIEAIKSKRYTQSRIQRILLYALLGITKKDIEDSYKVKPYVRILGVSTKGKILLSRLSSQKIPLVTSVKKFMTENNNKIYKSMLEKDILATNIYTLAYDYDAKANLDYTKKLIVT